MLISTPLTPSVPRRFHGIIRRTTLRKWVAGVANWDEGTVYRIENQSCATSFFGATIR